MSKHLTIHLSDDQRTTLNTLIHAGSAPARTHTRCESCCCWIATKLIFTDDAVAKALRCHRNAVGNVRRRFVADGFEAALSHKPLPPRAPKKLTGEVEAHRLRWPVAHRPRGSGAGHSACWPIAWWNWGWSRGSAMSPWGRD